MGDVGQTANSAATLDHLAASAPTSVLNVGDLSYADGHQPRWDSYGRLMQASAALVPQMTIEARPRPHPSRTPLFSHTPSQISAMPLNLSGKTSAMQDLCGWR